MSCSARFPVFLVLIAVLIPESTPFLGLDVRAWCMAAAVLVGPVVGLLFVQAIAPFFGRPAQASFLIAELPPYRRPGLWDVLKVMYERSKIFVLEAGKVILAVSIVLWFLASYGPTEKREQLAAQYQTELQAYSGTEEARADLIQQHEAQWLESSFAGQMGQAFEPLIRPLGYDWRIGVALLTSFAAREVFVGTMSTLFAAGNEDGSSGRLVDRLRAARNDNTGAPLFTVAAVVSLLLFYSLALQCMSTVAIMKRELGGWGLTLASLGWHTALAWLAAFAAWQLLS